jgi:hypothetical protein
MFRPSLLSRALTCRPLTHVSSLRSVCVCSTDSLTLTKTSTLMSLFFSKNGKKSAHFIFFLFSFVACCLASHHVWIGSSGCDSKFDFLCFLPRFSVEHYLEDKKKQQDLEEPQTKVCFLDSKPIVIAPFFALCVFFLVLTIDYALICFYLNELFSI